MLMRRMSGGQRSVLAALLVLFLPLSGDAQAERERNLNLLVPYVPTAQHVVDKMLEVAKVGRGDFLIDLGSGDGRIPITAARRFGTRGLGVDLNPQRVEEAQANAKKAGVTDKVSFRQQDLFETDISKASVVTLYLLPEINAKLRPRLSELKPGTRVVSHDFDMGDWKPNRVVQAGHATIYLWIIPARKTAAPAKQ